VKLHDLKPAPGSRTARTRVGRGIAAGKGKTAGRGTKGQKARAGGTIPAWFEGGQTPAHIRLPKLHGFKQRGRIDYQVVNVGRISEYAAAGRFGVEAGGTPMTINSELLLGAGLISTERRPVKVLGHGDVAIKLFVAADAFTRSARSKIEEAGGFVQLLAPEKAPSAEAEPQAGSADTVETPAASADTAEPAASADTAEPAASADTAETPAASTQTVSPQATSAGRARPKSAARKSEASSGPSARSMGSGHGGAELGAEAAAPPADEVPERRPKAAAASTDASDSDAPAKRGRTRKSAVSADE
jgi:large subunit ribosomal protein L15